MKPDRFFQRWQRRRDRLLTAAQAQWRVVVRRGEAEEIHALRVVLRRLRLLVRVGRPLFAPHTVNQFQVWARGLARTTGEIRDLDVALEWLATRLEADPALTARIKARRDRLWAKAGRNWRPLPARVSATLRHPHGGDRAAVCLVRRFNRIERRLKAGLRAHLPRYFKLSPDEQHAFRRYLRWWRYLRELGLPRRKQAGDRLLGHMVALQETTGSHQNRLVTVAELRKVRTRSAAAMLAVLEREAVGQRQAIRRALQALAANTGWRS
jgi:CHAD domain-containing protein